LESKIADFEINSNGFFPTETFGMNAQEHELFSPEYSVWYFCGIYQKFDNFLQKTAKISFGTQFFCYSMS